MSASSDFSGGLSFDLPSFSVPGEDDDLESSEMPEGRSHARKAAKREMVRALQKEAVAHIVERLPEPSESIHVIANGTYDFWSLVPHLLDLLGEPGVFYGSTWTMNRGNALELLALYDAGRITCIKMLTGTYFKRRESAVYATLAEGVQARGQRFLALENHAKLILLRAGQASIVVEGSANFTANPRVEQYVLTNDAQLFDFHAGWIDDLLEKKHGK